MARYHRMVRSLRDGSRHSTVRHGFAMGCVSVAILIGLHALPI
jgi:hypothetical protein